jgi:large subunit ribosomal protein L24
MSIATIRKNDMVMAVSGDDAGKTGKVLQVMPVKGRAIVEGINMMKKCLRKSEDNPQGGIVDKEGSIAISNLRMYCPNCKKGVGIKRVRQSGGSARKCKSCDHAFE